MRKLIAGMKISVDGKIAAEKKVGASEGAAD